MRMYLLALLALAAPEISAQRGTAPAHSSASTQVARAALKELRKDLPAGKIAISDLPVSDNPRDRRAPHRTDLQRWTEDVAEGLDAAIMPHDGVNVDCHPGLINCRYHGGFVAKVAMSVPRINGDTATIVVRYGANTGRRNGGVSGEVRDVTLRRSNGAWKVVSTRVRIVS